MAAVASSIAVAIFLFNEKISSALDEFSEERDQNMCALLLYLLRSFR